MNISRGIVLVIAFGFSSFVLAQDATQQSASFEEAMGGTLEDLLNITTTVASKRQTGARATPGIVTIITDEEIRNMGARDLIDVLRTVPSLSFGVDVQGVVGLGVRGMWAHEGKFLFIIDGVEMNEIQYGTIQFGNRYPVDQIKRIEIIRGPGSAIYGGFAELAVINVITKSGAEIAGARVQSTEGVMVEGSQRHNLSASVGQKLGNWDYSVSGYIGNANRGEGTYTGSDGAGASESFNMKDADRLTSRYVNAGVNNGPFNFRFIYDDYTITSRSQYGYTGTDASMPNVFKSMNFASSYALVLSDRLTITPYAHYYLQNPWRQDSEESLNYYQISNIHSVRFKSGTLLSYDLAERLNLLTAYEYVRDRNTVVNYRDTTGALEFQSGGEDFSLFSHALLAQALYETSFANFTVGARYEDPSRTDASFVPRFAITRAEKYWHGKFLYSTAFRSPVAFNLDIEPDIKPEKTQTFEVESGYATSTNTYLTANVFYTKIKDPIVYFVDAAGNDRYANQGNVATKGVELDWRYKMSRGQMQLGYSYYMVDTNKVGPYQLADSEDAMPGMPQHKGLLNGTTFLTSSKEVKLGTTLVWTSMRYAFVADEATGTIIEDKLDDLFRLNAYLSKENLFTEGLGVGLGVYNILNSRDTFVQPYNSGHAPLPGPSREIFGRVDYHMTF